MSCLAEIQIVGQIARIRINREHALNSLTTEMIQQLMVCLDTVESSLEVCAVFLEGSGDRAFCAGGDVKSIAQTALINPSKAQTMARDFFSNEYRLDLRIHSFNKPIIVWGSGIVMGGGLGLTMGASHRIATETSVWAMPEISIGFFPDVGASWFLNRLPKFIARFAALTGVRLNAQDIQNLGWSEAILDSQDRERFFNSLSKLQLTPESADKKISHLIASMNRNTELPSELLNHWQELQAVFSRHCLSDCLEAIKKTNSTSKWLNLNFDRLHQGSPFAASVIFQTLELTNTLTLTEVFQNDFKVAMAMVSEDDFAEGVRSVLIDKDQHPKWTFGEFNPALECHVSKFFAKLIDVEDIELPT